MSISAPPTGLLPPTVARLGLLRKLLDSYSVAEAAQIAYPGEQGPSIMHDLFKIDLDLVLALSREATP